MPNLHLKMKDIPKKDRPRERLIEHGASHLSFQELLAIIIGSGTREESVQELAKRVYMHFEGIELLRDATLEELMAIKGIGQVKAVGILATIELGNRMNRLIANERYVVRCPEDGAEFVMEDMRLLKQEHFVALFLNTKNQIIHRQTVFIGSLNSSIVHPREVFREAVKRSAASIICVHNHPSGVRLQSCS
ncbi:RadC family protein [Amphibacillus sediminis]|uniref:RadC family protein n=1 Tax=Amphibacillus sediminis TaxID=360185 RepID=UPI00082B4010|nr:DNA repair protein RadC [Amphibacillus sediminis]